MKYPWAISRVNVELVSDVSGNNSTLTRLIAREILYVHCRCESFKSTKINLTNFQCEFLSF
jgi:hypothetical protein